MPARRIRDNRTLRIHACCIIRCTSGFPRTGAAAASGDRRGARIDVGSAWRFRPELSVHFERAATRCGRRSIWASVPREPNGAWRRTGPSRAPARALARGARDGYGERRQRSRVRLLWAPRSISRAGMAPCRKAITSGRARSARCGTERQLFEIRTPSGMRSRSVQARCGRDADGSRALPSVSMRQSSAFVPHRCGRTAFWRRSGWPPLCTQFLEDVSGQPIQVAPRHTESTPSSRLRRGQPRLMVSRPPRPGRARARDGIAYAEEAGGHTPASALIHATILESIPEPPKRWPVSPRARRKCPPTTRSPTLAP